MRSPSTLRRLRKVELNGIGDARWVEGHPVLCLVPSPSRNPRACGVLPYYQTLYFRGAAAFANR
jgi:hypothetical protein